MTLSSPLPLVPYLLVPVGASTNSTVSWWVLGRLGRASKDAVFAGCRLLAYCRPLERGLVLREVWVCGLWLVVLRTAEGPYE